MSKRKRETTAKRGTRPTIALITDQVVYEYQADIATGVIEAAQERDVNLLCFIGGRLGITDGFESQGNAIYDLVRAESVDGVVILSSAVGSQVSFEEIKSLCESFHPLPIVSVGLMLEGVTSLAVDNKTGLHDVLVHLINDHGYRRLAFIRGPATSAEAELRYHAYLSVLEEFDLPFSPALVVPGDFLRPSGTAAVSLLLDERGADFDVIVAANDAMALGALEALQARGIRVPEDMAVVGFDDVAETEFATPPLTTVRQSLYKQGQQATEMVLALIAGEKMPEQVSHSAEMVIRQSCGCLPAVVSEVPPERVAKKKRQAIEAAVQTHRKDILSGMTQAAGISPVEFTSEQAELLLTAFSDELSGKASGVFLPTLNSIVNQAVAAGSDMGTWQAVLSTLRQILSSHLDEDSLSRAERLWLQARVLIGEIARRVQGHRALQEMTHNRMLWQVGATLITTLDLESALDVLAEGLPGVGISSVYLSLYQEPQPYTYPQPVPEWSWLVLAYQKVGDSVESKQVKLDVKGQRFRTRRLIPEDMLPKDRQYCLVARPLFFHESQIGFVLFEVGARELTTCEMLSTQISSSLYGARLLAEQRLAEETLTAERNLLRTLIDSMPDSVYVKDVGSRFLIANTEAARRVGAATPDELIGKTDKDLHPERLASGYSTDEQEVFQSGRPLINQEELVIDQTTGDRIWNLATKVPLRDSQGDVIGLVGIGRNITERRQTELALQKRALQLQTAAEVSRAVSSVLDPDDLVQQVVGLIRERFDLYYVGLFLVDGTSEWAVLRAGTGEAGQQMIAKEHKLEVGGSSMIGACVVSKQAHIALDVGEEAVRFDNPLLPKTRSELALPLVSRGEAIGALTIQSKEETAFSEEDVVVFQTMADQLANAIANVRLFEQAHLRAEEMVVLNELGQALSTKLSVQAVLDEVYQGASRLMDATDFYVALYNQTKHEVTFPFDTTQEEADMLSSLSADRGLTGYVIRNRMSLLIEENLPERMAELGIETVGKPSMSWMGAPMIAGDEVLGMLGVQDYIVPRAYNEHDRDLLVALANQTANALANARLFEQTQAALAEVESTQQRYLERAWGEYAQAREVSGYEQSEIGVVPLDEALPEVRQAMSERRTVILEGDDNTSILVVPVVLRGQPLGAMGFKIEGDAGRWGIDDIVLVEGIGEQFALAAENIRLLDETQRRAARERLTRDITDKMRRASSIEDIVQTAVDELFGALKTSRAFARLGVDSSTQGDGKSE